MGGCGSVAVLHSVSKFIRVPSLLRAAAPYKRPAWIGVGDPQGVTRQASAKGQRPLPPAGPILQGFKKENKAVTKRYSCHAPKLGPPLWRKQSGAVQSPQ